MVMNADGSGVTDLVPGSRSFGSRPTTWESNYHDPEKPSTVIPFVKIEYIDHDLARRQSSRLRARFLPGWWSPKAKGRRWNRLSCAVATEHGTDCLEYGSTGSYDHYEYICEACVSHIVTVSASTGAPIAQVTASSSAYEDYEPTFSVTGAIAFTRWAPGTQWSIYRGPGRRWGGDEADPGSRRLRPGLLAERIADRLRPARRARPDRQRRGRRHHHDPGASGRGRGAGRPYSTSPVFSPDGSKIAFQHYVYFRHGLPSENGIFTIAPNGAGLAKAVDLGNHPSWQPVAASPPPSAPPTASPATTPSVPATSNPPKGPVTLSQFGTGTVGTITCGTSACTVKVLSAALKVGKKKCPAKVSVPASLAAGASGKVTVSVEGKCLAALRKAKKAKLATKLSLTEAGGKKTVSFNATVRLPKVTKPKHHNTK